MINNECGRFMGFESVADAVAAGAEIGTDPAAAAAAEAYAAAMRDQAVSMRQGEAERGKELTKAYKEGDAATRQAIAERYQLTATQMDNLKPIWEKPIFWIGTSAGAGILLYLAFRRPSPAGRFSKR